LQCCGAESAPLTAFHRLVHQICGELWKSPPHFACATQGEGAASSHRNGEIDPLLEEGNLGQEMVKSDRIGAEAIVREQRRKTRLEFFGRTS
jgi:hypothetical protein